MKKLSIINVPLMLVLAIVLVIYKNQGYYSALILINPLIVIAPATFVAMPLFILNIYFFIISIKEKNNIYEQIMMVLLILSSFLLAGSIPASNSIYLKVGYYSVLLIILIPFVITLTAFTWITFNVFRKDLKTTHEKIKEQ